MRTISYDDDNYPDIKEETNKGKLPGMILITMGIGILVFFIATMIMLHHGIKKYDPGNFIIYSFLAISLVSILLGFIILRWDVQRYA